ncbi:MAG: histidinol dehydrogenase [Planctomycetaceae bacterium]|nr:histidinol dehydrogenase [Planctomycetaceae bacterium]MBP62445.1 histidinol dehydrogenase [Planctomycetaceae bacterium]
MSAIRIRKIDGRSEDLRPPLEELRRQLSPRGDIVSDASRQRTIDVFGEPLTPQQVVARICKDVQQRGIQALLQYNEQLDGAVLTRDDLRVPGEELVSAHRQAGVDFLDTVRRVRDNIFQFQDAILHSDVEVRRDNGTLLQQRYLPLKRVGLCVPGGAAAYPSTVLMTAVPALAAGVEQLALVAPPTPFGSYNIDLLATCHELGISEVYRMGGAQAVAALAFGVDGVPAVDKIVGPGNLFVALAKKHVYGEVDIDSIAGPSEVVIVADHTSRPDFVAADLLAQSEHAPGASILVTWNEELWHAVDQHLEKQLKKLSRNEATRQSLENYGALILVESRQQAGEIANQLAPEHLHLQTDNPAELLAQIPHAGAAFLGNFSPVCLGDYIAGPSHVLPTGGTARWASGLSANDFLRSGSVIQYTEQAMKDVAADVQTLADKEGLTAHRASVDVRLQALDSHTPSKD